LGTLVAPYGVADALILVNADDGVPGTFGARFQLLTLGGGILGLSAGLTLS
jgi:hypothetical protein